MSPSDFGAYSTAIDEWEWPFRFRIESRATPARLVSRSGAFTMPHADSMEAVMARSSLPLEIGAVLGAKLVLLTALFLLFFSHPVANDAPLVSARIVGAPAR